MREMINWTNRLAMSLRNRVKLTKYPVSYVAQNTNNKIALLKSEINVAHYSGFFKPKSEEKIQIHIPYEIKGADSGVIFFIAILLALAASLNTCQQAKVDGKGSQQTKIDDEPEYSWEEMLKIAAGSIVSLFMLVLMAILKSMIAVKNNFSKIDVENILKFRELFKNLSPEDKAVLERKLSDIINSVNFENDKNTLAAYKGLYSLLFDSIKSNDTKEELEIKFSSFAKSNPEILENSKKIKIKLQNIIHEFKKIPDKMKDKEPKELEKTPEAPVKEEQKISNNPLSSQVSEIQSKANVGSSQDIGMQSEIGSRGNPYPITCPRTPKPDPLALPKTDPWAPPRTPRPDPLALPKTDPWAPPKTPRPDPWTPPRTPTLDFPKPIPKTGTAQSERLRIEDRSRPK